MTLPILKPRPLTAHKGEFGHVLLVGGTRGMTGAIVLAGKSSLRSGAGLTTVAVPHSCLDLVASFDPCYMTLAIPCNFDGSFHQDALEFINSVVSKYSVLAIGPGLGAKENAVSLVRGLYPGLLQPIVVDADALNAISGPTFELPEAAGPRILTPHPGEFERLSGIAAQDADLQRKMVPSWALKNKVVVVLKGHKTIITDGVRTVINETGNPAMATGGSGDCLTGVIAALLAQHLSPFEAAWLGVAVHGELKGPSILGTDIINHIPAAFSQL
ncbi:MAG: NAD(P)H-hydrate dehydratase [Proteobacteria bacterium]|nr:NAD(P)H-hydrate dehydratase [Pseudomonadota bacterium]